MNEFFSERLGVPYEEPKRTLIVAKCFRHAEDYMHTLPPERRKLARYVSGPSSLAGTQPDLYECHLIGPYWENSDWREIEYYLRCRGLETREVYNWR